MKKTRLFLVLALVIILPSMFLIFNQVSRANAHQELIFSSELTGTPVPIQDIDKLEIINNENNIYYNITNLYGGGRMPLHEFFEDKNSLYNLKQLNRDLHEQFIFLEIGSQPIHKVGYYEGNERFVISFPDGTIIPNQLNQEVNDDYITTLKAYQLDKNAFDGLERYISYGRGFEDEDFNFEMGNVIPVILGSSYKEYYNLDDEIELQYIFMDVTFKVIGFFDDNAGMFFGSNIDFNDYIIMPFFNILDDPDNEEDEVFQKRHYIQKNHGFVGARHMSFEEYENQLRELTKENDLLFEILPGERIIKILR